MNIQSVVFTEKNQKYALTRIAKTGELLLQLVIDHPEPGYSHTSTQALFMVTNEAVTASLIFAKIHGYSGTAGDLVDYKNMVALLTQG